MSEKVQPRRRPGRVWRLLRWFVIFCLLVSALALFLVATAPGGRLIALTLNRLGSGPERSVEIDRIEGLLSGSTRIGHVLVRDGSGEPWLLVRGINIDWSPLALISSGLAIDNLRIDRIEFARPPAAPEAAGESGSGFQLPLAVSVKRFTAPDILLGEEVAGRVARFEASGSLTVDAALTTAMADLTLNRIDGVGGQFTVDADYLESEERFNISANLSEPAGGVMAHLLNLSPEDAISLSATSQGSLADWRLSLDGSINSKPVASAHLKVVAGEAGDAVSLEAEGSFDRFLPPAIAQLAQGRSDLLLEGLIEPDRTGAVIDVFTYTSMRLTAQGRGRVAREGEVNLSASMSPRTSSAMLEFGEGASALRLSVPETEVRVSGSAQEASVRLVTSLANISGADFSADDVAAVIDFDRFSVATQSGEGDVEIRIGAVGSANDILARAVAGGVDVSGDIALAEDGAITSEDLAIRSGVADLGLASLTLSPSGDLSVRLWGNMRSAIVSEQAESILGESVDFSADLSRSAAGASAVRDLVMTSPRVEVTGRAELDAEGEIAAEISAALADLSGLGEGISGGLQLQAVVNGTPQAPAFDAKLTGSDLKFQGRDLSDLRLEAEGVADPASPSATVSLSGMLDGQAIDGSAKLGRVDGVIRVDPLRLQVAENLISGSLVLDDAFRPTGTVEVELSDIASLSTLALQQIDGNGGGTLEFDIRDGQAVAEVALQFPEITHPSANIRDARLDLVIYDYLGVPRPTGSLSVASVDAGSNAVSGLNVEFTQSGGWTEFDAEAQAAGFPVTLDGRVKPGDAGTEIELAAGRTSYKGLTIALSGPARAVVRDGVAQIERLVISPGGGEVSVKGAAGGENLDINADVSSLPLSLVNALAPGTGLSGTVSGRVNVTGSPSSPRIRYDLRGVGVGAVAASSIADVTLSVDASGGFGDGRLDFDARANGGGLSFAVGGGLDTGGSRQLSVRINGTAPFGLLSAQLARQGIALSGAANVDLTVSGTPASPAVSGSITTSNARIVDSRSGIALENLSADIGVASERVTIRSLSGELSSGGRISGSGTIGIAPGSGYPADLDLRVERGRYADGQLVATRFDAELSLTGALVDRPALGGLVRLDETTISVPDTLPASIAQLDVTHRNAPATVTAQSERLAPKEGSSSSGGLGLDLTVQANRIFVRGRGLDAELGGSVRLSGSTGAPVASGGFDLLRGRLTVLGKRLDFDRGRLGFAGSVVPILDFAASTRSGGTTVTVLVTGPANQPRFNFTSSPQLPEDEVLAQLIFGRSLNDLSPLQIAQLAEAAGQLTGVVSGGGVVERLRRATGVDDIDVRTDDETGETSIGVGKYLNDNTYLGLESGASAGSGKARIDLDIGRGIKLRGEADSSGETKGGIFFEREY
ncbi:MAG: translocation/assembly module TamB domain-containing protein [Hoeflea sp.]|uniref:translocation/assembly module TamB domain-containing protein n=1 Tax=Hoeflea sp. TaxID=1940281 RepID=UPI0032ED0B3F